MKQKLSEIDTSRIIVAIFFIVGTILFLSIVINFNGFLGIIKKLLEILSPVIYGFIFAFLLSSPVRFFEKKILTFKKLSNKTRRTLSILITFLITIGFIVLLSIFIIPQLLESITTLAKNVPSYLISFNKFMFEIFDKYNLDKSILNILLTPSNVIVKNIIDYLIGSSAIIISTTSNVFTVIFNIIIGSILSIYMLASKDKFSSQIKKILTVLFSEKTNTRLINFSDLLYTTFNRYITGQLIDSLALGAICFVFLLIFGMPYPLLISVIITATNIIPIFGPIIGAIPSAFIILVVNPQQALIFVIFIIVLQQFDGNYMCPKIVGNSTGLDAFWVIFAIIIGKGFFGIAGMVVAVPIFSVFITLFKRIIYNSLENKSLTNDSKEFL